MRNDSAKPHALLRIIFFAFDSWNVWYTSFFKVVNDEKHARGTHKRYMAEREFTSSIFTRLQSLARKFPDPKDETLSSKRTDSLAVPIQNTYEPAVTGIGLNIDQVDSLPLDEINKKVESKISERKAVKTIFSEQLMFSQSPWLETVDLMNEKVYGNRELLGIEEPLDKKKRLQRKRRAIKGNYAQGAILGWYKDIEKQVSRLVQEGKIEEDERLRVVAVLGDYANGIVNSKLKDVTRENQVINSGENGQRWKDGNARNLFRNILSSDENFKPVGRIRSPVRVFVENNYKKALQEDDLTEDISDVQSNVVYDSSATNLTGNEIFTAGRKIQTKKILNRLTGIIRLPSIKSDESRRQFLKTAAAFGGAAFMAPVIKAVSSPEVRAGIGAAVARPDALIDGVKNEASIVTMVDVWKKHFKKREHLLPIEAWLRTVKTSDGGKIEGNGVHLNILADHSYEHDKKPGETFDEYYTRFVDNLSRYSEMANLDFITLVASLQISAENLGGFAEPKRESNIDVAVSRIQEVGVTSARSLGIEEYAVSTIGPGGTLVKAGERLEEMGVKVPEKLRDVLPAGGIRFYDLIRFREQPTVGLMDMEPGERAASYGLYADNPLGAVLKNTYPEVAAQYEEVNKRRAGVDSQKEKLRTISAEYIEKYHDSLEGFAKADRKSLKAIGISPDMNAWQDLNYTDVWYKGAELPTNPEFTYKRTAEYMKTEAKKDIQTFLNRLMSQQIRNPKFLKFLRNNAERNGREEEMRLLLEMEKERNVLEEQSQNLRISHLSALAAEGPYEYDSRFQQINAVLVTKRLSQIAGEYNPSDRNSLGWHIYKTSAIREIAPIPLLVDDKVFARDITIDPPYAAEEMVRSLDTFSRMISDAGMVQKEPDKDIKTMYQTLEKMFWRDGGVWPDVARDKWEEILRHFNTKMANRFFYDFIGLLDNKSKISELNGIMIESKLISEPAQEDPYEFFTQLVYLMLNSWHMRRDISREDWDKAEAYVRKSIMPLAIMDLRYASGLVSGKWSVGSADYPPIFRSQAVMYNFLSDSNPLDPLSSSSGDVVGHH